jgi:chromosome segregation and condensation protein ScpB
MEAYSRTIVKKAIAIHAPTWKTKVAGLRGSGTQMQLKRLREERL